MYMPLIVIDNFTWVYIKYKEKLLAMLPGGLITNTNIEIIRNLNDMYLVNKNQNDNKNKNRQLIHLYIELII